MWWWQKKKELSDEEKSIALEKQKKDLKKYMFGATHIPESGYKGDLEALDRYLKFTEEILRLSIIAIGAEVSYLQIVFGVKDKPFIISAIPNKEIYFVSLILFTLAAAFSLFHRFQSTDGFTGHLQFLRGKEKNEPSVIIKQAKTRNLQYKIGGWGLVASCWALGLGIAVFIAAVFINFNLPAPK